MEDYIPATAGLSGCLFDCLPRQNDRPVVPGFAKVGCATMDEPIAANMFLVLDVGTWLQDKGAYVVVVVCEIEIQKWNSRL